MNASPLQDNPEVRSPEAPRALGWYRSQVSSVAEEVAELLDYRPGDPLEPIVRSLGGTIEIADPDARDVNYGSIVAEGDRFVISLPLDSSPLRDRFTLAHELGHLLLHYRYRRMEMGENIPKMRANRFGDDQAEYEANWFAAAFLMPGKAFRVAYHALEGSIPAVADKFKVSQSAATVRAKSLKLL